MKYLVIIFYLLLTSTMSYAANSIPTVNNGYSSDNYTAMSNSCINAGSTSEDGSNTGFVHFEEYYDEIEPVELENWVKYLLSQIYTEKEVQSGLPEEDLTDEYQIKFNVKGKKGRMLKVQVSRRNQRLRGRIK